MLQASPDVASCVRHLDIISGYSPIRDTSALCTVLSSTHNLRDLAFHYMYLHSDFRDIVSALPSSLEYVELTHIYLLTGTVGDLIFLWSRLPRLRSFVVSGEAEIHGPEIQEEYICGDARLW